MVEQVLCKRNGIKMLIWGILSEILFYITLPFFFMERVIHKKSGGWKQKFGFCDRISGNVIMLHGCSVGEITAIEDLAKRIKTEFPEKKLVITTSTLTGQAIAKKKLGNVADYVTFFPFDIPSAVNRFLKNINPSLVLIAETEIWPCFAYGCKKSNIPLYIINGRISDLSYWMYKLARLFFKKVFNNYTAIFTQSYEDREKFVSIGVKNDSAEFMGNLKFCIQKTENNIDFGQSSYKIILAGSTHGTENPIIINTYKELRKGFSDLKLLIAPRHLERVKEIEILCEKAGLKYGHRSKNNTFSEKYDVIILDTLGELKYMYSLCHIAFIGGSFNKTGGHNPLEATICEKPVFSGPKIFNFKDIYRILTNAGAARVVSTQDELFKGIQNLLNDTTKYEQMKNSCNKVFCEQSGALDFVINKIRG